MTEQPIHDQLDHIGLTAVPAPEVIKRRQQLLLIGIGSLLFVLVVGGMWIAGGGPKSISGNARGDAAEIPVKRLAVPGQTLSEREVWIATGEARIKEQSEQIKQLLQWKKTQEEKEQERLERERATPSTMRSAVMPPPLPSMSVPPIPQASASNGAVTLVPPPVPARPASSASPGGQTSASSGIQRVTLSSPASNNNTSAAAPGAASAKENMAAAESRHVGRWIPAGSFTRGTLLGGLDAPAGGQSQSNPHPVLVKLQNNSILPNRFRTRTRECHVVGAGYGDISSERAYIRLETLSCVLKTGKILEVVAQGYIAGEDGKTGMRGKLVTKEGQLLSRAFLAGLGSGIGSSLAQSVTTLSTSPLGTTQSVDPGKVLEHGAYAGVGKAMDRLAQYYITLAEKTFPVIEIAAGRTVDVVLTKGVALDDDINLAWDDIEHSIANEEE